MIPVRPVKTLKIDCLFWLIPGRHLQKCACGRDCVIEFEFSKETLFTAGEAEIPFIVVQNKHGLFLAFR